MESRRQANDYSQILRFSGYNGAWAARLRLVAEKEARAVAELEKAPAALEPYSRV